MVPFSVRYFWPISEPIEPSYRTSRRSLPETVASQKIGHPADAECPPKREENDVTVGLVLNDIVFLNLAPKRRASDPELAGCNRVVPAILL